jgi:hypothetical protein
VPGDGSVKATSARRFNTDTLPNLSFRVRRVGQGVTSCEVDQLLVRRQRLSGLAASHDALG